MNVKCWGPTAWYTLHKITALYPEKPTKDDALIHYKLFASLRNVLPCKHCRTSYTNYFKELDITDFLGTKIHLMYWLYLIHNKVNDKLRKQGFLKTKDPTFKSVYNNYTKQNKGYQSCCCPCLLNTINCIAFNYQKKENVVPTKLEKKNIKEFMNLIRYTLPCSDCKKLFNKYIDSNPPKIESKSSLVKWAFGLTNEMRKNLKCNRRPKVKYTDYINYYNSQSTGCGINSCRI